MRINFIDDIQGFTKELLIRNLYEREFLRVGFNSVMPFQAGLDFNIERDVCKM